MEYQEHFGRKFYKDSKTGYWISTDYPRIRAHRWVWNNIHGMIPKGYHIHHRNENKSDNHIGNLELIHGHRHLLLHMTEERKEKARKWAEKIRPLTKAWHSSEKGRTWHKLHGIEAWEKKKFIKKNCNLCRKEFSTKTYHQEFCSNRCKSKFRRDSGIDNVQINCEKCGILFSINKYYKQRFCSKSCAHKRKKIND